MLYYEAHVTLDPVPSSIRHEAAAIAEKYGFSIAKLLMDKGVPSQLDTFMTARSQDYRLIEGNTINVVTELQDEGYVVRRYKIEDTLLDSRIDDELGLL